MWFLKSAFITGFIAWLAVAFVCALLQLGRGAAPMLSWLGLALASSGPLAYFASMFFSRQPRTRRHPVEFSVIAGLGLAMCMAMAWRHGEAAGLVHAGAAASVFGWLIYLRWYAPLPAPAGIVAKRGASLPDFQLHRLDGATVRSGDLRGQPHVLVFIRGSWCPFCVAQVRDIAEAYRDLQAAGAQVMIISSQPLDRQRSLAERFNAPMDFMCDPGNRAARQLGIAARWGTPLGLQLLGYSSDTALPAVIITDANGRILDLALPDDYRFRPEPADFLRVLAEHRRKRAPA